MDATARRLEAAGTGNGHRDGSSRWFGWAVVGCVACCLAPLLAATGVGTVLTAMMAPSAGWAVAAMAAGGVILALIVRHHARGRANAGKNEPMNQTTVCRLPLSDRAQRTADFRALFADTLVERVRLSDGVRWTLRASATTEAESRRLAALEARCCDGIRFDVAREGEELVWRISGPPSAKATLDALYELPVLVRGDESADELWASLDAAACGPRRLA